MSREIPRIDLSSEIEDWRNAIYGEEVRDANVSALTKVGDFINDVSEVYEEIAEDFDTRDEQWAEDLETVNTKASQASTAAESASSSAEDAEAYAIGKRGGTDVGTSDPTYHNNSKYYATQAGSSATAAAGSAGSAADSADDAESAKDAAEAAAASVMYPISYRVDQSLDPEDQATGRSNIGAASDADLSETKESLSDLSDVISDAWSNTKTYAVGDYCIYNETLWKCKVQHSGQTPTEGTYWTAVNIGDEIKTQSGSHYVKFADGTLIQFNKSSNLSDGSDITLAVPFFDTNYTVIGSPRYNTGSSLRLIVTCNVRDVNKFYVKLWDTSTNSLTELTNVAIEWVAIGRWK